ncbi:uncharacterized protein EKO05_0008199 [Ascochyta rabiei]|uniref:Uncharacterized protein n=1 Tax=Didymella rabiei TaxID=5454 RepID=A0A163DCE1_DIDRA|nr:uncharacterized protein EKO05_0008199 [Ascochyta rabiei]KZM23069.1 hypothetical protein ST47_g5833 [Ascochyta rabiei]UPX17872.1 hypothetical protein EKO05_0008199 [Ascochyta rabiei]
MFTHTHIDLTVCLHPHTSIRSTINTTAVNYQATQETLITSTAIIMQVPSFNMNNNFNLLGGSESRDGGSPNRSAKFNLPTMKAMRGGPESRDGG